MEGNSRYSIIFSLTEKKLKMLKEKADLKDMLEMKKNKILENEYSLGEYIEQADAEKREHIRDIELQIEKSKREYNAFSASITDKEATYNEQIKAIEEGLKRIEDISASKESSSSQDKQ